MFFTFMKKRNSIIFGKFEEKKRILKVITKFPEKWVLIDTENLKFFQGSINQSVGKQWDQIKDTEQIKSIIEKLQLKISSKKEVN